MSEMEIDTIINKADFIVAGYAFIRLERGKISIVHIEAPNHAAVIDKDGNVLETNMHDIELDIVLKKYWATNKKQILNQEYA